MFPNQMRWFAVAAGVAVLVAAIAGGAWFFSQHRVASVASSARECVSPPQSTPSLFFDDQYTQIRVSSPDLSNLRVLRSEPSNVMPGMFESLLALSPDASRLGYVTAQDEMMNGAYLYYLDVSSPDDRHTLADVASGLSPVRPAWSPDGQQLAYVTGSNNSGATKYEIWVARAGSGQPEMKAELPPGTFAQGHTAALCWSRSGNIGILPGGDSASRQINPTSTPVTAQSTPTPSPTTTTGGAARCGVPVLSQNDPAWQTSIMLAGGDPIGGFGCALTSTAMLLDYFGANITPPQLSACLGGMADPVDWASAPACTKGLVTGGARFDFSWPQLDSILGSGRPAIVGMMRGLTGMHWVVVSSGGGEYAQNYRIVDPWDGTTTKTLGSYSNAGYQLRWIVSMDGQGQGCGRLLKGGPPVKGFTDGSSGSGSVTVTKSNPSDSVTVIKQGQNPPPQGASPSPSPTGGGVVRVDKSALFVDEGVYLVIIIHKGDPTPIVMKFTIDKTPPVLGVTLVNPLQGAAVSTHIFGSVSSPRSSLPSEVRLLSATINKDVAVPTLARPGKLTIEALDTLSGMNTVSYSLDGAAMVPYSDETNNHRQLTVDQPGPHTLTVQAVDLAGNPTPPATQAFVVQPPVLATPTPTPTPTPVRSVTPTPAPAPTPPPCAGPTISGLTTTLPAGTTVVTVSWAESMACGFASGNLIGTATWGPATGKQPVSWTIPLTRPQGPYSEDPRRPLGGCGGGQFDLAYTLILRDAKGNVATAKSNSILYTPCG